MGFFRLQRAGTVDANELVHHLAPLCQILVSFGSHECNRALNVQRGRLLRHRAMVTNVRLADLGKGCMLVPKLQLGNERAVWRRRLR